MAAELTLGAEEELHLIDLESWKLSARAPQLLSRLPADNYSAEIQRTTVETNTEVVSTPWRRCGGAGPAAPRPGRRRRRRRAIGIAAVGTAPQLGVRRLRAHHHRPLRADAGAVPAAGRRAADLRPADPRRRQRPRPGRADHAAGRRRPAGPARPVGQLAVLERAGHRLRQHPVDHLAALAHRRRHRAAAFGQPSTTSCSPT